MTCTKPLGVLVVDDDPAVLDLLREVLAEEGYAVTAVSAPPLPPRKRGAARMPSSRPSATSSPLLGLRRHVDAAGTSLNLGECQRGRPR